MSSETSTKAKSDSRGSDRTTAWAKSITEQGNGAVERTQSLWLVPPESLVIHGIDTPEDPKSEFYDDRIHRELSPEEIEDVDQRGVLEIIKVASRDGKLMVVDGRQRTRRAREANKRRALRGAPPMRVRVLLINETDPKVISLMSRSLNAFRVIDGPLQIARNAQRNREYFGITIEQSAAAEGIAPPTMKQYLSLLKLSPVVQNAVETGAVAVSKAIPLAALSPAEQEKQLGAINDGATAADVRKAVREKKANAKGKAPGDVLATIPMSVIRKIVQNEPDALDAKVLLAFKVITGNASARSVAGLTDALREAGWEV